MRLIDADALEKLLTDMATDAKSIRELQLNALCYAAVKSESMTPTIDAIPVEWLRKYTAVGAVPSVERLTEGRERIVVGRILNDWQKEQEGQF